MAVPDFIDLLVELVKSMAVVIVVAYLFTRTKLYLRVMEQRLTRQGRLLLTLIFGAFSIWGTLAGVPILGGIANTRDMGAALGGLVGGPLVGLGAGLIGGVHRLSMGGYVALPSGLGAVTAGLAGGAVFLMCGRRLAPWWAAMLLAVFTETLLMALNLVIAAPFELVWALVRQAYAPMIIVNAIGMGVFVFILRNEEREREDRIQKERMEGELEVARKIQLGIVPTIFPPFPEHPELDLYATLESAREVGGDLYDFFLLDDERLAIAVGDVAGKGVPASLFMAVTITLMRAVGHRTGAPAEVLERVNAPLCRDNDTAMFVTLFFAVYHITSGTLAYSTGGHPPPYILRADGDVRQLRQTKGAALGVSERIGFAAETAVLRPGDTLLLYTDGVTEAMDARDQLFGSERLEEALRGAAGATSAEDPLEAVRQAVARFTAGAEQSDDITLVSLRRAGT